MCLVSPRRLPEQLTQFLAEQFLMQEVGADDGDAYLHVEMVQMGCLLSSGPSTAQTCECLGVITSVGPRWKVWKVLHVFGF